MKTALLIVVLLAGQTQGTSTFHKVRLLVPVGEKPQETEVSLRFEEDRMIIRSLKGGGDLKSFPYKAIKSAEYSYSKSPRWKSGAGVALAAGIFAIPIFFMKGKKHWLTIQGEGDYAVLRLDKNNYKIIAPAFEAKTGIRVDTAGEEK